jgi:acetyltransferase
MVEYNPRSRTRRNDSPLRQGLDALFEPRTIVVFGEDHGPGGSSDSLLKRLKANTGGARCFPVNPYADMLAGAPCAQSLHEVPQPIDLTIITTPAERVAVGLQQAADAGVAAAIVLTGTEGEGPHASLAAEVHRIGRERGIRILGPSCLGLMRPPVGLNMSGAACPEAGHVALVSQSAALCHALIDWSFEERIGFSSILSLGDMADIGWGDVIDYLAEDPHTRSILLHMESLDDARHFLSAAREVAFAKPVILLKGGRSEFGARAAATHTGALAVSDDVLEAACQRVGVLRVDSIEGLFLCADVLAKQPRPRGPRLAIVTNAGGPAVLAIDALAEAGGQSAARSFELEKARTQFHLSAPVDLHDDADAERYERVIEQVQQDNAVDGVLAILTPQSNADPTATAHRLAAYRASGVKPLLASWMGGSRVLEGRRILTHANIPVLPYPETAARLFCWMWRYSYNLDSIYEIPALTNRPEPMDEEQANRIISAGRTQGNPLLSEAESKQILAAYGFPTITTHVATTAGQAVAEADRLGYPVALKVHSHAVAHKRIAGGVHLDLPDRERVGLAFDAIARAIRKSHGDEAFEGVTVQPMAPRDGVELLLGVHTDPQFGPVLTFGSGGSAVAALDDRALALPPLNRTLARRQMERTRIHQALRDDLSVDLAYLETLLVWLSQLVTDQPAIACIDVNPLLVSACPPLVLDARITLHGPEVSEEELPRPAIRAYPSQYVWETMLKNGTKVTIRPIRPEDEPAVAEFHERLSDRSVRFRYFHAFQLGARVTHERLRQRCFIDYDRELALVAEPAVPDPDQPQILAIGRLRRLHRSGDAEFAIVVADGFQRQGLGRKLLTSLIDAAQAEGVTRLMAEMLRDNTAIQSLCRQFGFSLTSDPWDNVIRATLPLSQPQI